MAKGSSRDFSFRVDARRDRSLNLQSLPASGDIGRLSSHPQSGRTPISILRRSIWDLFQALAITPWKQSRKGR